MAIPKAVADYLSAIGSRGGKASSVAKTRAVRENGKAGGTATSTAKTQAARENGKKGGRPRKVKK